VSVCDQIDSFGALVDKGELISIGRTKAQWSRRS